MIFLFVFLIILVSVGTIAYPLFCIKLQKYSINYSTTIDFNKTNFWLSAISDLDDDFSLGRITKTDYKKQKLILQRNYLGSIHKLEWKINEFNKLKQNNFLVGLINSS